MKKKEKHGCGSRFSKFNFQKQSDATRSRTWCNYANVNCMRFLRVARFFLHVFTGLLVTSDRRPITRLHDSCFRVRLNVRHTGETTSQNENNQNIACSSTCPVLSQTRRLSVFSFQGFPHGFAIARRWSYHEGDKQYAYHRWMSLN